jgi:hypothetical protein
MRTVTAGEVLDANCPPERLGRGFTGTSHASTSDVPPRTNQPIRLHRLTSQNPKRRSHDCDTKSSSGWPFVQIKAG